MDIHKNARLTPHGRERMVKMVQDGQTPQAVSEAVGVCPGTVRKWVERYRREGLVGLQDCSSWPRRLHRPTPQAVVERIKALRWPVLAVLATALYFALPESLGDLPSDAVLVLFSAAMAAGLLALAVHFGRRRSALGDSLGANAYGIYLLHYPIVLWIQYAFVRAPLGAEAKAAAVMVLGFGLSWLGAGLLRRLPGVARLV